MSGTDGGGGYLSSDGEEEREEEPEGPPRLVGLVRPEPVGPRRYPVPGGEHQPNDWKTRERMSGVGSFDYSSWETWPRVTPERGEGVGRGQAQVDPVDASQVDEQLHREVRPSQFGLVPELGPFRPYLQILATINAFFRQHVVVS